MFLVILSLFAFLTVYFAIYAVRAISDGVHKHNFKTYTVLASVSAAIAYGFLLSAHF